MGSPAIDVDVCPHARTKEENQERAFIAASRRKDRSLDARVESADRASRLHKQRTGKALLISRDIVEQEAMYEEVDGRYQEKLQIEFYHNLITTFAEDRPSALHQRRASRSRLNPPVSLNGIRKISLDLSGLRDSVSEGMRTELVTNPLGPHQSTYGAPPPTYSGNVKSPSYRSVVLAPSGQLSSHFTQAVGGLRWPAQVPAATMGEMNTMLVRQFWDRMSSAPVIPAHTMPFHMLETHTVLSSGATVPPTTIMSLSSANRQVHPMYQQTCARSDSDRALQTLSLANPPQNNSSPGMSMESTEPVMTPDLCSTSSTPQSPTSTGQSPGLCGLDLNKDESMGQRQEHHMDSDYEGFSRFEFGLSSGSKLPEFETVFDGLFPMEDIPILHNIL
ncbi:uncharacterized protein BO87DRAFT_420526 [Aspergillus neoniger CBS 115656]|uniref:Uncharacterized protein n=1 Tax=Aspergillus neoniger (strain CBS 115656) TaxID=1448310 RepID=A0A318Y5V9_ASPNB|nr:hypothetical protein BO87DRAFT_420526 [Aspergillus neoniger CBS 115656]PYH28210.1 hypothetical protein BO87DRAFT_420526 [Aspergillus neoniger CBS 115656]